MTTPFCQGHGNRLFVRRDFQRPRTRRRGMRGMRGGIGLVMLMAGVDVFAQTRSIPVRDLGPVVASTTESLGTVFNVWQFDNGRVLINDGQRRRMLLFDSTLTTFNVIADT